MLVVGRGAPERGGIAAFLETLRTSRLARDHDLRLLNLTPSQRPVGGRVSGANLVRAVADAGAVWRAARGCDVVHVHSALAPMPTLLRAGLLAAVARARRARVVVHAHGGRVPLWLTTAVRRVVARAALVPAHAVVAVSSGGRDALVRVVGPEKVALVDNGVDVAVFDERASSRRPHLPPRVLFVGGLTERKGLLDLLLAAEELGRRGVDHELWLVGGTPDEGAEAEARVRAAAGPDVRFLGQLPHEAMPGVLGEADVLVLPSWWEAMPLSVLEAMAAGLPVVATRVGDVGRLVVDGETGVLVEPRRPGLLADALATVLGDPERAAAMGRAGRKRALDRFDLTRTIESIEAVYTGAQP